MHRLKQFEATDCAERSVESTISTFICHGSECSKVVIKARKVSDEKLTKIIQAVTMAVLAFGEAKKFSEEQKKVQNMKDQRCA